MNLTQELETAREHHQARRLPEAEQIYRAILNQDPQNVDAMQLLGVLILQSGQPEQGLELLQQALTLAPEHTGLRINLAAALVQLGQPEQAMSHYRAILQRHPNYAPAHLQLGELCRSQGLWVEAETHLNHWVALNPDNSDGWQHLANLHRRLGRYQEAAEGYRKVLQKSPEHIQALSNLASVLQYFQQFDEAKALLQKACELAPDDPLPRLWLGSLLLQLQERDAAMATYQQILELDPSNVEAWVNLGVIRQEQGEIAEARNCLAKALDLRPQNLEIRLRHATLLPVLLDSPGEAQTLRQHLNQALDQLETLSGELEDPERQIGHTPYLLAYHGIDDKALIERLNRLYRQLAPTLNYQSTANSGRTSRLRVGFVSEHLKVHTIGYLLGGLIEQLPRKDFEITLFHFANQQDALASHLQAASDKAIALPYQLEQAQQIIADSELDLLFYPDIGLSTFTYCLAFARLAPVQCTTWGHGVSTGLDTIDYFFSSKALEHPNSQALYTEQLIQMDELIPYYAFPEIPAEAFEGLPEGRIYLCPQSLFKLQPHFDSALAGILKADSQAQLVFLDGSDPHWKTLLLKRWQGQFGQAVSRMHFLPRLTRPQYLSLMASADVILDPFDFCGGNSSYEAFAAGTPVVTLPGELLRGRITYALYQKMGIETGIASNPDDYVRKAVQLANDQAANQDFRTQIASKRGVLFNNQAAIDELAGLLLEIGRRS